MRIGQGGMLGRVLGLAWIGGVGAVAGAALAEPTSTPASTAAIALGPNASLGGARALSPDSPWNTPIDHLPVDPASGKYIAQLGADAPLHPDFGTTYRGAPWGIPYVVVDDKTRRYPVRFEYADESDDALYPIPPRPPIEAGSDHHLLVVDLTNGRERARLYELLGLHQDGGAWRADCGAIWDLFGDTHRPRGWTSADAAGLPIFPGLVRYDEVVERGKVEHALRFTAKKTGRAFVAPATHFASKDPDGPPMGMRVRLKASVDVRAFPERVRPIVVALRRYGMFLADNGGPLFLSGAPDPRWNDAELETLKRLHARDFEVVSLGNVVGAGK